MYAQRYAAYAEMAAYKKTREFQEAYANKHGRTPAIPSKRVIIKDEDLGNCKQQVHVDVVL